MKLFGSTCTELRQEPVNGRGRRVKEPSGHPTAGHRACTLAPASQEGVTRMADVAYVALTVGIFALLALMVRGLEKLT